MKPTVTVLLAVHDGEPYLRQCVDSVLGQTFGDFELLIVDDASCDSTPAILASYDDPRIRVLRNAANLGQVPSLNRGLREARGDYVARIDADDWCRPPRLARQVEVLERDPAVGLVGTWMDLVDERDRPVAELRSTIADFAEFVFHTLIMRVLISHPSAMFRRDPVLALGGYDERTGPAEDKDLWRRLLLERWHARIVPEPLVVYRVHEAQLSRRRAEDQRRVDGESQDRFLAALAPDLPIRELRQLLAHDDTVWAACPRSPSPEDVERLLEGAAARLRLEPGERRRVRELVAARVLTVARTRPWRADARSLARASLRALPPETRARARGETVVAVAVAPLRVATRAGARAAKRLPVVRAVHAPASRSRLARRLYAKLVGSS
jgi:GT2 family glycosyltransferase